MKIKIMLYLAIIMLQVMEEPRNVIAQKEKSPFLTVPESQRQQLIKRLEEYLSLKAKEDHVNCYYLLSNNYKASVKCNDLVDYLSRIVLNDPTIVRFEPKTIVLLFKSETTETWLLEGCAEYNKFGKNSKLVSGLEADYYSGNWFFSDISVSFSCIHCKPKTCKF